MTTMVQFLSTGIVVPFHGSSPDATREALEACGLTGRYRILPSPAGLVVRNDRHVVGHIRPSA